MNKLYILLIILFLNPLNIFPYEKYLDFDLIKKPDKPRFFKNGILFTLSNEKVHQAFLRTNLDNWKKNYYFEKNLYNVLYTFVPFQEHIKELNYKININGYWVTDPYNSNTEQDILKTELSTIKLPEEEHYFDQTPIIAETGAPIASVRFRYYDENAMHVNFVCSIDNWALYSHKMEKNNNGYWEITKKFTSGKYYYYFLVDGKKVIDMENYNRSWNNRGEQVSYFIVK